MPSGWWASSWPSSSFCRTPSLSGKRPRLSSSGSVSTTVPPRPVFVYGEPFNHTLAKKLLKDEDGSGCSPTRYAGVFLYMTKENKLGPIVMCAGGPDRSDATVRKLMEEQWADVKVRYQKDGPR